MDFIGNICIIKSISYVKLNLLNRMPNTIKNLFVFIYLLSSKFNLILTIILSIILLIIYYRKNIGIIT